MGLSDPPEPSYSLHGGVCVPANGRSVSRRLVGVTRHLPSPIPLSGSTGDIRGELSPWRGTPQACG